MLHRSFKPAKCKTALKLSVSRIKLLKNKKEALVKQQRRELAQLLESGQERTARIRVEHVVREEKAMAAYDLIEIYCELIVARMPIIESQKHCPIDLKEAIASVIFASPRCADIPELMDVRKHFTAKYGKEFVAAALEIRPDCGVSRLLVEKLSVKAPDGPEKIKILTAIAEEHNVKWDRESFEENEMKPPEDLLNGPNTFGQASKIQQEAPKSNDRAPPHTQASFKHDERHDTPVNSHDSNSRSSLYSQNHPSTSVDASHTMSPGTSHPQPRTSGNTSEATESRHFYASGQVSSGRQSWTMEFTDATTAAQAAAESAERASMAARAAAELSSQGRITRQHSTESNKSSVVQNYGSSRSQGEHIAKDPAHNSLRSNAKMDYEQTHEDEEEELSELTERFNNLKSSIKPTQTEYSKPSSSFVDRHSENTPSTVEKSDSFGKASMKRESSESDEEFSGEPYSEMRSEDVNYFEQASFEKQSSSVSSYSHSQNTSEAMESRLFNDFSNVSQQESKDTVFDEHFIFDRENIRQNTEVTNAYGNAGTVFDDSGSEDDTWSRKSPSYRLSNTSTKSPELPMEDSHGNSFSKTPISEESTSIFSEGLPSDTFPSQEGNFLPVTFDDSDGPDSDSEDELNKSEVLGRKEPERAATPKSSLSVRSSFAEKVNSRSSRNTVIHTAVVDSRVEVEAHSPRKQGTEARDVKTDTKLGYGYLYDNQASHTPSKFHAKSNVNENIQGIQSSNTLDDDKPIEEPSMDSGTGLRFGNLTGGLRNKGYKHPPYHRNALEKQKQSVSEPAEDNSSRIDQSPPLETASSFESDEQMVHRTMNDKSSSKIPYTDARNESEEKKSLQTFYSTEINNKPVSSNYFDSDNSDSDEDHPKPTTTSKTRLSPVLSRRTKASFPDNRKDSHTKSSFVIPETSIPTDSAAEKKSTSSVSSYAAETRANTRSENGTSEYKLRSERSSSSKSNRSSRSSYSTDSNSYQNRYSQSRSLEERKSAESRRPSREDTSRTSAREKPANSPSNTVAESKKLSNLQAEAPSRENSIDKASHVHPKLPDYDTLTAHLLSLRQNRGK